MSYTNKRKFDAAQIHASLPNWIQQDISTINKEIELGLPALRTRSRDGQLNNPYLKKYFKMLKKGVIGHQGIRIKPKVKNLDGTYDIYANNIIQEGWNDFSDNHATINGRSLRQFLQTAIVNVSRDGEALVLIRRNRKFKYGFKLELLDNEYLDEKYNAVLNNGNEIQQSVEYNQIGETVAYWIWKNHPNHFQFNQHNERIRVTKDELIVLFDEERSSQGRGYPWTSAALIILQVLDKYQKSELYAALFASQKSVFFTKTNTAAESPFEGSSESDDEDEDEGLEIDSSNDGLFNVLSEGWGVDSFNPTHPNGNFTNFKDAILRAVASSLDVGFHNLANHYSSGNYASLRLAQISENETYKDLQEFIIENLLNKIYQMFLPNLLKLASNKLPLEKISKFKNVDFIPKKFPFVDPAKELNSISKSIDLKITSRDRVIRENTDTTFAEIAAEIAEEKRIMEELGISDEDVIGKVEDSDMKNQIEELQSKIEELGEAKQVA